MDFSKHAMSARKIITVLLATAALSGCSAIMKEKTYLSDEKMTVTQEDYRRTMDTNAVNEAALNNLRNDYWAKGSGPVHVTVTYDPRSKMNTAMSASNAAGQIAQKMRCMGATDVQTEILPVNGSGGTSQTIFAYDIYKAHAPAGCTMMGGVDERATEADTDYKFGCSEDILLARQIARPKDLLGNDSLGTPAAKRQINWINTTYNDGVKSEPIDGYTTSDAAGN